VEVSKVLGFEPRSLWMGMAKSLAKAEDAPQGPEPETNWDERLQNLQERRDPDGIENASENIS